MNGHVYVAVYTDDYTTQSCQSVDNSLTKYAEIRSVLLCANHSYQTKIDVAAAGCYCLQLHTQQHSNTRSLIELKVSASAIVSIEYVLIFAHQLCHITMGVSR